MIYKCKWTLCLPWVDPTAPGVAGRKTNFCGLENPLKFVTPVLGRAETKVAIVTWPAAFLISKLVGCWGLCKGTDVDVLEVVDEAVVWGGAGAILAGVFDEGAAATLRTRVTLPPANLVPPAVCTPALPASNVPAATVDVPTTLVLPEATETLLTTSGCP